MITIKFLKDYKKFKKGQYLEFPAKRYTGQTDLVIIWEEIDTLLKDKIAKIIVAEVIEPTK